MSEDDKGLPRSVLDHVSRPTVSAVRPETEEEKRDRLDREERQAWDEANAAREVVLRRERA